MQTKYCKKVSYATKEFAMIDIERIRKKPRRKRTPLRAYKCGCGAWHLTSQKLNPKFKTELL